VTDPSPVKPELDLTEHLEAGVDDIPIRVLAAPDELLPALRALAAPLGLRRDFVEAQ
jgi:hypothetical protein